MSREDDLNFAKLAVFSKIDKAIAPQNRALNKIIYNIDEGQWGNYRGQILNVKKQDVIDVCKKYILQGMAKDSSSKTIFGSSNVNLEGLLVKGFYI